jgi:hypothetical protein
VSGDLYSCQVIPILDADFEENRFGAVLTALAVNPAPDAAAKTAQTERLENIQSLKVLKEKLDEQTGLRGPLLKPSRQNQKRRHAIVQRGGSVRAVIRLRC